MFSRQQHLITHTESNRTMFSVIRLLLPHLSPLHRLLRTSQCIFQFIHPHLCSFHLVLTPHQICRYSYIGPIHQLKRCLPCGCSNTTINSKLTLPQDIHPLATLVQNKCPQNLFQCSMLSFCLPITLWMVGR